ncbi:MAG: amidohydrolase, partial [Thermoanaerobaculia bacterium]
MRRWNISEDEADPPGGHYGRTNGRLNGWIYEHAGWRKIAEDMAKLPDEKLIEAVREFSRIAMRRGITSVQSMPTVSAARMAPLSASANVPLRWRWIDFRLFTIEENPAGPVKYVLDGTPIERGAAMGAPYTDRPSERGRLNYSDADLRRMVDVAARTPHQLLVHLAGDAGIEKLFAAMHAAGGEWNAKRVRIEHGDMIGGHAEDARSLGVVLVQNPAHLMIPELVETRIGSERMASYQLLRSMVDRGVHVALGSDGPLNPWLNVMFATIHPRNPSEALTREQAVRAYTAGSAYAEFAEKEKGTLAPGMLADLAILSQDVFTVPPPELPKTTALVTMIGGKVVHGSLDGL